MGWISWSITAVVAALVTTFVVYLIGLVRLPTAHRPRTPTYDRTGRLLGMRENPDYRLNPQTGEAGQPDASAPSESDDKAC